MDTGQARRLYSEYAGALAYVEVEDQNHDLHIGSSFHVGEGVFVTARHVVEGSDILSIGLDGGANLTLIDGPYFHADESVDVAVFKVSGVNGETPIVPLGTHVEDYMGIDDFVLTEAIVLGYPPIPMSTRAALVGARAEVSAHIQLYDGRPYTYFALSAMARGGFSGGPVFSEYGFALGMITRSLIDGEQPVEQGYMTAIAVEPLYECLADHRLLPDCQAEPWDGLWNSTTTYFYNSASTHSLGSHLVAAGFDVLDDGKRLQVTVNCEDNPGLVTAMLEAAVEALQPYGPQGSVIDERGAQIDLRIVDESARQAVKKACVRVAEVLRASGYLEILIRSPEA